MIARVSIGVRDVDRSKTFSDAALGIRTPTGRGRMTAIGRTFRGHYLAGFDPRRSSQKSLPLDPLRDKASFGLDRIKVHPEAGRSSYSRPGQAPPAG